VSKKRKNFSLDEHLATRLENEVDNQSQVVNQLLQSYLNHEVDDEITLKERLSRLKEQKDNLQDEKERTIEDYNKKISSVNAEIRSVQEKIQEREEAWITLDSDKGIKISSNYVEDKWTDKRKTREVVADQKIVSDVSGNEIDEGTPVVVDTNKNLVWRKTEDSPNSNLDNHKTGVLTEVTG